MPEFLQSEQEAYDGRARCLQDRTTTNFVETLGVHWGVDEQLAVPAYIAKDSVCSDKRAEKAGKWNCRSLRPKLWQPF